MKKLILSFCFSLCLGSAFATTYYCDPVKGNINNKGTASSPWSTLDSVFIANKKLLPGDTIILRNGYHGFPVIKGNLTAEKDITILPQKGHSPTVKKLLITNASHWRIVGLKISPEVVKSYERGDFVGIKPEASFITLENCTISSTDLCINDWTAERLLASCGVGIRVEGKNCILLNNTIKQVMFGVLVSKSAVRTLVSGNTIYGFVNDGIRGLADQCIYEYNTVAGSYGIDDNHDDAFQSWSTDEHGKVGMGKVSDVILRGNLFVSQIDPNQPFLQERGMQGIGNFDGFFENWTVENNIIITNMWHGIAFYGAKNCKITNNTVLSNPLSTLPFTPWIAIYDHKKGMASEGNSMKNNLATDFKEKKGVVDDSNNRKLPVSRLITDLKDWKAFDVRLNAAKAAVGAVDPKIPKLNTKLLVCEK